MNNHLATAAAIYEAFGKGDIPTILSHMAEDVQWEQWADNSAQRAGVPWLAPRQGKAGVIEFFQVLGGMPIKDFQVLAMLAGGNQVAVEVVIEVDVPSTGGHFRDEELHLWNFDSSGKVIRMRHYTDTAKHIAAAKA